MQGAPGDPVVAPGEMPVTQAEMDEFNAIPVNTEYSPPTSDPFLVSGAAGGARLPQETDLGEITADDYGMEAIYTSGTAYGLSIRYPTGASQIFQLVKGSDELINISDAFGMSLGTDLLLSGKAISIGQQSTPASPPTNFRKIFVDTDNSNHLTVLKSDGSEVDLEAGGWTGSATSDLDMNTYDIIDVDRLQFTSDSGEGRDNTKVEMYANANTPEDAIINFPDSAVFRWTQNGTFFVAVDEDGIVPRLDDDWSIGTASYQLKDLQTKLWTADQGTIKQYLTMSNTGAGGDHYAYVVGQMTSSTNCRMCSAFLSLYPILLKSKYLIS